MRSPRQMWTQIVDAHREGRPRLRAQQNYASSPSGTYTLTRDGKHVLTGTEQECWAYIHGAEPYSVDRALRFEGYRITPTNEEEG